MLLLGLCFSPLRQRPSSGCTRGRLLNRRAEPGNQGLSAALPRRGGVSGDRNEPSYRPLHRGLIDCCAIGAGADHDAADLAAGDNHPVFAVHVDTINAQHTLDAGFGWRSGDLNDCGDATHVNLEQSRSR